MTSGDFKCRVEVFGIGELSCLKNSECSWAITGWYASAVECVVEVLKKGWPER